MAGPMPGPACANRERSGSVLCGPGQECVSCRLPLCRNGLPFLARFFHHADEYILQRETFLPNTLDVNTGVHEPLAQLALQLFDFLVGNQMKAIAEERNPPALHALF